PHMAAAAIGSGQEIKDNDLIFPARKCLAREPHGAVRVGMSAPDKEPPMSRKSVGRTSSHDVFVDPSANTESQGPPSLVLTPEQLQRWADLVARGEADLPLGLAQAQEEELQQQVRRLRRALLVQFIARQIAQDIQRPTGAHSLKGGQPHAAQRL